MRKIVVSIFFDLWQTGTLSRRENNLMHFNENDLKWIGSGPYFYKGRMVNKKMTILPL